MTLSQQVASVLLEAVLGRPKGTTIEEAIAACAKRLGLDLPESTKAELARAIASNLN